MISSPSFKDPSTSSVNAPSVTPVFTSTAVGSPEGSGSQTPLGSRLRSRKPDRSEEHTSELQSLAYLVCRLLLEKKKRGTIACRRHHLEAFDLQCVAILFPRPPFSLNHQQRSFRLNHCDAYVTRRAHRDVPRDE